MYSKIKSVICLTISIIFFYQATFAIDLYRRSEAVNLPNGVSVIFVNTNKTNFIYLTFCISAGTNDALLSPEIAKLCGQILQSKITNEINLNNNTHGTELNSYCGYDQTLFSLYGKKEDLKHYIKILGEQFSNFQVSNEDIIAVKPLLSAQLKHSARSDKEKLRKECARSLYWHAGYGLSPNAENLDNITNDHITSFAKKNYTNNRVTLIIGGNVDKNQLKQLVTTYFTNKTSSDICRLKEPNHHDSTAKLSATSSQLSVPFIEYYWKIPNYKENPEQAAALNIVLYHLQKELKKSMVEDLKLVSSIQFDYSFWNYAYGDLKISVVVKPKINTDEVIMTLINEIRRIVFDAKNTSFMQSALKEIIKDSDVFNYNTNVIDTINWIAIRVAAGYDFEFLKNYLKYVKSIKQDYIEKEAFNLFKKDPNVISVLTPIRNP